MADERIVAVVVLRKPNGSSILDAPESITASSVRQYAVDDTYVNETADLLEARGFEVLSRSGTSLSIAATRLRFEGTFSVHIQTRPEPIPAGTSPFVATESFTIPADLADRIVAVTLPTPPELLH